MKWDVHIHIPSQNKTITKVFDIPETEHRSDVRLVYSYVSKLLKIDQKYLLAVPHVKRSSCS
jgi:RNase P subunit RPR2